MSYPPPAGPPPSGFPPPAPPGSFPSPGAPMPPPRRKSKAGLVVLAILLPIGLVILICGGIVGVVGYTAYQEDLRTTTLKNVGISLGIPTGYRNYGLATNDRTLDATYIMYCDTSNVCQTYNPVKQAFNWLVSTGFAPATEQNVALCFRNGCTMNATRPTDAGDLALSATLQIRQSGYEFNIAVHGELTE